MTALAPDNVYFRKSGRGKIPDALFSKSCFKYKNIVENILFLHAVSGCDTTSALFGQGKLKFCRTLQRYPSLNESVRLFKDPAADKEKITEVAESFFVALYEDDLKSSLDVAVSSVF